MTVYIVMGTTGEYSDHREWSVVGYKDKTLAELHVILAQEWSTAKFNNEDRRYAYEEKSPYDNNHDMSYTGTSYYLYEIEILDAVPNYEVKA